MASEIKSVKWFRDDGLKKIVFFTLGFKLAVLVVIAIGAAFLPFRIDNYFANFHYPTYQIPDFFNRFKTWDAQHYLYLADHGYKPHLLSNAFDPLFPWLIHVVGFVFFNHHLMTGLFLSTLFTVGAMVLMYRLIRELYSVSIALNSCLLLLAFPMSFFIGILYSESLFLLLVTACFYFEMRRDKKIYLLCLFLLPLTRSVGVLVVFPLVFKALQEDGIKSARKIVEMALSSLLGLALYFLIMQKEAGNWLAIFEMNYYWHSRGVFDFHRPLSWFLNNFVDIQFSFNHPYTSLLARCFFVIYVGWLIAAWNWLPRYLWVYVLIFGMVPGLLTDLGSFARYLVVIFPLFIVMAICCKSLARYWIWGCFLLQVVFILLYSINDWVA